MRHTRWLTLCGLIAACLCGPQSGLGETAAAKTPTLFPRLGGMLNGSPQDYDDPAYQREIAKFDIVILGMYNGWNGGGKTPAQVVREIKTRNPGVLLGNYTIMTEVTHNKDDTATAYLRAKLSGETGPNGIGDWWAYNTKGRHTDWAHGAFDAWDTNLTLLTMPDAHGDRWPQWLAKSDYRRLLRDTGFDIWYSDNNFWKPRSDADWNRDGTNDSQDDIGVRNWWRDGQRAYYDTAHAQAPNLILMGNTDSDLDGAVFPPGADRFTQYRHVLDGAFMEHVVGEDWSVETWGGWSLVMQWYRALKSNLRNPRVLIFDAWLPKPDDYRYLRYAFASCLMDDGYFSASTDYHRVTWFDEYDLAGAGSTKWLGAATDKPQKKPWSHGVYRRRFAHGMVLVNPKGNGVQTVQIDAGYRHFQGKQDPNINDGQPVSQITLQDRDGIFLVKD